MSPIDEGSRVARDESLDSPFDESIAVDESIADVEPGSGAGGAVVATRNVAVGRFVGAGVPAIAVVVTSSGAGVGSGLGDSVGAGVVGGGAGVGGVGVGENVGGAGDGAAVGAVVG